MNAPAEFRDKLGALFEVLGVFITGTFASRIILRITHISSGSVREMSANASIDYLALAWARAATLLLQYGIILSLAFLIGWWYQRRGLSNYGVSAGGLSVRTLLTISLVLFSVGGLLPKLLIFAKDHISLGEGPPHWDIIASGNSAAFWIYMAVASFGLVPIVEELFFRGYAQTRLAENFGPAAAIIMTALVFTLSHRQYFIPSVLGIGMSLSLFASSVFAGYARHRYGTILPGVLAHALGNVPVRGWAQVLLLGSMLLIIVAARGPIHLHLRELLALLRTGAVITGSLLAVATITAVLAVAAIKPIAVLPFGAAALLIALVIEWYAKHRGDRTPGAHASA